MRRKQLQNDRGEADIPVSVFISNLIKPLKCGTGPKPSFRPHWTLSHWVCPSLRGFSCLSGAQSELGQGWRSDTPGRPSFSMLDGNAWGARSAGPRLHREPLWGSLFA